MIVDLILVLTLVVFILTGRRKGLIMSLFSLLILAVACLGASAARETLTPTVAEWMQPKMTEIVSEQLEKGMQDSVADYTDNMGQMEFTIAGQTVQVEELLRLLRGFGIDVETSVQNAAQNGAEPLANAVAPRIAASIVETIAGAFVFLVTFIILYMLLYMLELAINVVDKVPVVHTLNHAGGALAGLVSGVLVLMVAVKLMEGIGLTELEFFQGPICALIRTFTDMFLG